MIELRPAYMTLTAEGLTAQQAADAVKVLRAAGIETVTITQEVIAAEVPDAQPLAPEGVGATFIGHPVEWYSRPQWEHDEMARCDYLTAGEQCALPAFHEVPPLGIPHTAADAFPDSTEPEWPTKDFSWGRVATLQGAARCGDEHTDTAFNRTHVCVLPMGHGLHAVPEHTDHPEGPDAPEAYVWF